MVVTARQPYHGTQRKLLLAFDLGTTYSGISYAILDPGVIPEIKGVTRFPAQERVGGDSKIPSIIFYDRYGGVCAAGAEALEENTLEKAEDEAWFKVEWFKLHLVPKQIIAAASDSSASYLEQYPLPHFKDVVGVIADFFDYLYQCAKSYIQQSHTNGDLLWATVEPNIEFVLSHPNGWGGKEQARMRQASIAAGLIPDTPAGHKRVQFVTEGEASLHFCMQNSLSSDAIKVGDGIQIIDAGGGTIDISSYSMDSQTSFKETAAAQCLLQGSVFVSRRAHAFLTDLTRGTRYGNEADVTHITQCFDKSTKPSFRSRSEPAFIKFGSPTDREPRIGIRSGQLKLQGNQVGAFFEPSVAAISKAIHIQQTASKVPIKTVFLVGGFGASPWLFAELQTYFQGLGLSFSRPDSHLNKAVADGAISFALKDQLVAERVSAVSYGVEIRHTFDPNKFFHAMMADRAYIAADGLKKLNGFYSEILPKGVAVQTTQEFRHSYCQMAKLKSDLADIEMVILTYTGESATLTDMYIPSNLNAFPTLCTVTANASNVPVSTHVNRYRERYYQAKFDVVISFGLTELKAEICWNDECWQERQ